MDPIEDLVALAKVKSHLSHTKSGRVITVKEFMRADALTPGSTFIHPTTGQPHLVTSTIPMAGKPGNYVHSQSITTGQLAEDHFLPTHKVKKVEVHGHDPKGPKDGINSLFENAARARKLASPKQRRAMDRASLGLGPRKALNGQPLTDILNTAGKAAHKRGNALVFASAGPIEEPAHKLDEQPQSYGWDAVLAT